MNCGFEDTLVLHEILEKYNYDFGQALPEYSIIRNPDAEAIIDLAMHNYIEMRAHVNSNLYLLRKRVDGWLNWLLPNTWIPLYSMTTFSRIRYHQVIEKKKQQDKIITGVLSSSLVCAMLAIFYSAKRVKTDAVLAFG